MPPKEKDWRKRLLAEQTYEFKEEQRKSRTYKQYELYDDQEGPLQTRNRAQTLCNIIYDYRETVLKKEQMPMAMGYVQKIAKDDRDAVLKGCAAILADPKKHAEQVERIALESANTTFREGNAK